ncbi:hypothetical protein OG349_06295 [Streptomyces sp. NBC_01317]|uniref:hypothetical protein n=1 Tax=Streptomyces sp. NBC_01317 TaxID=2903822 RepID=UPI002E154022|nr:hypothetical protein OG349_06295 [Streptomyces sp. NBC_01317]
MTEPIGPTMAGGIQKVTKNGYSVNFYPDANNYELMKEGKNPVFYWLPTRMTIARKDDGTGDYKFNLTRFAGLETDAVGGVLSITTTGGIPAKEWEAATKQVIEDVKGHTSSLWNPQNLTPDFMPVTLASNNVTLSNLDPSEKGYQFFEKDKQTGKLQLRTSWHLGEENRTRLLTGSPKDGLIDKWYWALQGAGAGSIDPSAEHAFVALVGNYPAQLLYAGFKGTSTGLVFASSAMQLQMWTPKIGLKITGDWEKVQEHFSTHTVANGWFLKADIQTELNKLKTSGAVKVTITPPAEMPDAKKIAEQLEKHSELIVDKFLEEAQRIIFEPAPVKTDAAETSSGTTPWGLGFALKKNVTTTGLHLQYEEETQFSHLQDNVISSSLTGILREEGDVQVTEPKYFSVVYLDDWPAKLARVCTPIAAWNTGIYNSLSVQIGYPNTEGALIWGSHVFSGPAVGEKLERWSYSTIQKTKEEVSDPPEGWEPDRTFIKRAIHFAEPDPDNEYVIVHLAEGHGDLPLDPGENGTPINESIIEVRAESHDILAVNIHFKATPTTLTDNMFAELTLEPVDTKDQPVGGEQAVFACEKADSKKARKWVMCPAVDPANKKYRYKVKVTDFEEESEWETDYKVSFATTLNVPIPKKNGKGVTFRFKEKK